MQENSLFVTLGHTAAGKTTLSKYLLSLSEYSLYYVEEGDIKRKLVGDNYSAKDSLNEELRDKAYRTAIDRADTMLNRENVLIDASFHRIERRNIVYQMLLERGSSPSLIWLYCYCPNINKVEARIQKRKFQSKTAETQADSMSIYYHIVRTFSMPSISEIPNGIEAAIIYINTDINCIEKVDYTSVSEKFRKRISILCDYICEQQKCMR